MNKNIFNQVTNLTDQDEILLKVATKMTVLSITMTFTTEFVLIVAFIFTEMCGNFLNGFLWLQLIFEFLAVSLRAHHQCISARL